MIDFEHSLQAFRAYVNRYDVQDDAIRLKITHTYAVVDVIEALATSLAMSEEDVTLAKLIGLLHDIGRFEQWRLYHTYVDHASINHAAYGVALLFDQGLITDFLSTRVYDDVIRTAIAQHNKFRVDEGLDERTMLFVNLIRDADKIDNFRVKDTESLTTLLQVPVEDVVKESISETIYEQFAACQLIYAPSRKTHLDMWLSWIAFIFDLHFEGSKTIVKEKGYIERAFARIIPIDPDTYQRYMQLKQMAMEYLYE